jgi:hypothetical protein
MTGLPRPVPMEAGGAFTGSSRVQPAALPALELFEDAARDVELPHSQNTIVIADYGAAPGHNSLWPVDRAISIVRSRTDSGRPIFVFHVDVADDDYAALFRSLGDDPHSYLRHNRAIFASAIGQSVYQQVLPTSSVTLAWCSWAVHWLSRIPAAISDHVHMACSHDDNAIAAYAGQAADDWIAFMTARSRELAPGGRLVVLTMARDEGEPGYLPLLDALGAELRVMGREGLISTEELARMAIPSVARTEAELTAPFAPRNQFSGLSVEHLEVFDAEDKYWTKYQKDRDATAWGTYWTGFVRMSVVPTLLRQLDDGPSGPHADQFVDRLQSGLRGRLAADPKRVRIPLAKLLLVKRSWPR